LFDKLGVKIKPVSKVLLCQSQKKHMPLKADTNRHFSTDHLKADFKGRSVRGGAVTMLAQAGKFSLFIGSNAILARLLAPQDYGLFGMVIAITGFVSLFNDIGLSAATVQKAEINHNQVSTLFWVNAMLGLGTTLVTAAIAPSIAWFYGEPRLTSITLVLASAFVFAGMSVQHQALLQRQMRFTTLAVIDIISLCVGIAIAIMAAWYKAGYWALVWMQLGTAISNCVGVWIACGWLPGLPRRHSGVRSMLVFGGNLTGFSIVNYFSRNLDNILIGRVWGANALGFYSRAYNLMMLPLQQINAPLNAVAIPSLSLLQGEPKQFRHHYLKALKAILALTIPIVLLMLILSQEIVQLLLGSQWSEVSIIFLLLGISAFVQPITNTSGWLYVATAKTDRMFKWGLFSSALLVTSFFIGLPYGIRGVALSYSIAKLLQTIPCMYYATRATSITLVDILHTVQQPFVASLLAGAIASGSASQYAPSFPVWVEAILTSIVMVFGYALCMFYLFDAKDLYVSILRQFKRS
jgi:O-antigen/teichoic acid export membrane protein